MSIYWHLTALLLLHSCTPGICMDHHIVGGKVSVPYRRPYMVYIRDLRTDGTCGGFLIRDDFVLTAAHCKKRKLMVYLGVKDTYSLPEGIEVDPIPYPGFTNHQPGDDIMLLKLKTKATINKTVNIIALPKSTDEEISKNCMVLGWGWQNYMYESPSRVLREVNLTLTDSKNCATDFTICTKGMAGPSMGDGGGPLICGDFAHGIVSHTIKTAEYLTMYTQISHYLPWIHHHMNHSPQNQHPTQGALGQFNKAILEVSVISICTNSK